MREELPVPGWQNGFSIAGLRLPPFRSASGEMSGSIQSSKQEGGTRHRSLGNPVLIILCRGGVGWKLGSSLHLDQADRPMLARLKLEAWSIFT